MQLLSSSRFTYHDLTRELEHELIRRAQAGDSEAAGRLVQAHERFIFDSVKCWFGRGLDKDDVLQAGREGYLIAIRKFDCTKGNRLNTYAKDWAWASAQKAVAAEGSTIAVGRTVDNQVGEHRKAGREIPERLQLRLLLRKSVSLSGPVAGEEDRVLEDIVPAPEAGPAETTEEDEAQARRRMLLGRAMTCMTPRERDLVRRRLLADEPESLAGIGRA